ncbi:hypothetical protein SAMN04488577_3956 [Bacillus sp. cl95]|nr:hypothetical protein SAMN02799634_108141 [Bacillus sp. UNCCL13]SFQ90927.1 hypothetical protein SAMN04488577_3956 [Bacillus sp. cl95]
MPLLHMKEVFTPLKLFGIKIFRCKEGYTYIKVWKKPRKRIFT